MSDETFAEIMANKEHYEKTHPVFPSGRRYYTTNAWEGKKYPQVKDLPLKEIAKLIKKELRETFKGFSFSVRTKYFSGGCSIDIFITAVPSGFKIYEDGLSFKYTKEATDLRERVEDIANQYRYVDSDSMIDYFDTSFYVSVSFGT